MNSSEKVKFFLFIIYSLFFLLITTDYLTLNNLIYDANQTDLLSYTAISKEAPFLPKDNNIIIQHVAQRFLIPYIIGIFAKSYVEYPWLLDLINISPSEVLILPLGIFIDHF